MITTLAVAAALPARATFPGDNGRLVFAGAAIDRSGGGCSMIQPPDIYTMRPDGTDIRNLTESEDAEFDPVWSHDGERIAYSFLKSGEQTPVLRKMQPDGTEGKELATSESDLTPSWSDHAHWITYTWTSPEYRADVRRVRSDGSASEDVVATDANEFWPSYSPDGDRIAFISDAGDQGNDIWSVKPDGSEPRQLTHNVTWRDRRPRAYGGFSSLGWSPDGEWILFSMNKGEGDSFVYKMKRNGDRVSRLGAGRDAVWSPNGKRILYLTEGDGCAPALASMRPNGSGQKQIETEDDLAIYSFDWKAL